MTVSVTSSAVGNPVSSGGTFTFNEGATVYDALCALGLSVNAHGSSYGTYVSAIGGLAEKQHGGTSGWMYSVNGTTPMTACSNYVLSNGDNVARGLDIARQTGGSDKHPGRPFFMRRGLGRWVSRQTKNRLEWEFQPVVHSSK